MKTLTNTATPKPTMEQHFLNVYRNGYPKDTSSQAVASERARARAAGWEAVMGPALAGEKVNRDAIKRETDAALSNASTPVKITTARRGFDGQMTGSIKAEVGSRQLAADRLAGMHDALIELCDAYVLAGAKVGVKVSVGQQPLPIGNGEQTKPGRPGGRWW